MSAPRNQREITLTPAGEGQRESGLDLAGEGCASFPVGILAILIGALYVLNPGGGVIEFIPDNIPIIGNLDEAGATALVFWGLRVLGRRRHRKEAARANRD